MIILIIIVILILCIFLENKNGSLESKIRFDTKAFNINDIYKAETKGYTVFHKITNNKIYLKKLLTPAYDKYNIYHYPFLCYYEGVSFFRNAFLDLVKLNYENDLNCYTNDKFNTPSITNIKHNILTYKNINDYVIYNYTRKFYSDIKIVDYFQEKERLKCKRVDQTNNVLYMFEKQKKEIAETILKKDLNINPETIYETIMKDFKFTYCSEFLPSWVVTVIKFFRRYITINNVLDMSAGRGARLIGCLASGCNYTATDPNVATTRNCNNMAALIKMLSSDLNNSSDFLKSENTENLNKLETSDFKKAEVLCKGFEDFESTERYDLVLSSPPYFNLEIYNSDTSQSYNKHNTADKWVNNWLIPCIQKGIDYLVGGYYGY